jgi:sialate O-acetylesterase
MKSFCLTLFPFAVLGALVLGAPPAARADVKLPAIYSDHAVLQQDAPIPVWGRAQPGEEVSVSIAGQTKTTMAGKNGKWMVKLDPLKAGGPLTLTVKGLNTVVIKDVLVGEVWLGSGQSNMALPVEKANNFEQEKAAANLPQIRSFLVEPISAREPQADGTGEWRVCSPDTVGKFSATAYFFGRELHRKLDVPVGLIKSCVGGTPIESWISPEAQRSSPELKAFFAMQEKAAADLDAAAAPGQEKARGNRKELAAKARAANQAPPRRGDKPAAFFSKKHDLGGLFNGMIAPLIPYALRGALWYQGEANARMEKAPFYQYQLPLLVQDWRTRWQQGDFPFAWVQLPNFGREAEGWLLVREAMLKSLKIPNTGMAVTVDIGDPTNIHPKNKQDVGKRLALWALGTVYGQPGATSGPLPAGHQVNGSEVVLSFTHTDGGLVARGGDLRGFTIAGADKKWVKANAKVVGETVVVSHPEVQEPRAVRYGWAENPDCNLYNDAGLPASPFRTDDGR